VTESRYVVRPKADHDLEEQAFYYATEARPELGHRFLVAAHECFTLLATQPEMGWHPKLKLPELKDVRVFRINGFEKILVLYRPIERESRFFVLSTAVHGELVNWAKIRWFSGFDSMPGCAISSSFLFI
jgi:plasmid stabilization system protein ParE